MDQCCHSCGRVKLIAEVGNIHMNTSLTASCSNTGHSFHVLFPHLPCRGQLAKYRSCRESGSSQRPSAPLAQRKHGWEGEKAAAAAAAAAETNTRDGGSSTLIQCRNKSPAAISHHAHSAGLCGSNLSTLHPASALFPPSMDGVPRRDRPRRSGQTAG